MKKKYKWIFLAVIAALSAGAYGGSLLKPVSVEAEAAVYGDLQNHFTVSATVLPKESTLLNSVTTGNVSDLPYREGAEVKQGEIIAATDTASSASVEIEREQYRRQLSAARQEYDRLYGENGAALSDLKAAESEYRLAQKNYDNGLILEQQGGYLSKSELEELKSRRDLLYEKYLQARENNSETRKSYYKETIDSCEKQLAALEENAGPGVVRMPYDGVLWELYAEEGAFLASNQPVAKVYRPSEMKLEAAILSEDAASLKEGMEASVVYADESSGTAVVTFLSKTAIQQLSAVGMEENRCIVELTPDLLPASAGAGQKADVFFTVVMAEQVLTVPSSALVPVGEETIVYLAKSGKAVPSTVTTGRRESGRVEILSGLAEGDIVISDPYNDNITEGSRISTE